MTLILMLILRTVSSKNLNNIHFYHYMNPSENSDPINLLDLPKDVTKTGLMNDILKLYSLNR